MSPLMRGQGRLEAPAHHLRNRVALPHDGGEQLREDGLRAVAQRLLRLVVDFDQHPVGPDGNGGSRHRCDLVAFARAVARIDQDRQVTNSLDSRDDGEIEGVAGVVGERPYATFTEYDVVVALGHDVFGREEKFCMLRAPIWMQSAYCSTSASVSRSIASVTIGRSNSSRTRARISSPFSPRPWKE